MSRAPHSPNLNPDKSVFDYKCGEVGCAVFNGFTLNVS